jgi:hypothetical protein
VAYLVSGNTVDCEIIHLNRDCISGLAIGSHESDDFMRPILAVEDELED